MTQTDQEIAAFDLLGPLPTGTTMLEASAGTGKTFTIAALATRYVAEGLAELPQLMLVTFSRAATQELRERVRDRLVTAEQGLSDPARARADKNDPLLQLLADAPDDEVGRRHQRLTRALAAFDAATIATTHGFCQQMLAGLGIAGDTEPDATLIEDLAELVAETVDDLFLQRYANDPRPPMMPYATALKVARDAIADPQADIVPASDPHDSESVVRQRFAAAVRLEVARRKRTRRLLDYDDLLSQLDSALRDQTRGAAACERLRARYTVVLVDEFQDTDPLQWRILETAFHLHATLVLIGDPKQAIYAFRGADLVTYLKAAQAATSQHTLSRNWRSDADLLTALETVFRGAALGDASITVRRVEAEHGDRRLTDAGPALRIRLATRSHFDQDDHAAIRVPEARPLVAEDVAFDIVSLLSGPARLTLNDDDPRDVRPGDVAVLVRTNDQAVMVRDALERSRVPAVITGTRSVFTTPAAREWLTLLRALEQPHRAGLVRTAALTDFVGWTAHDLATASDSQLDGLATEFRAWRDVLAERGVAALMEVMTASRRLIERALAAADGERDVTDLRHIGHALHAAAGAGNLGPAALVEWLQHHINEAAHDDAEERSRRLESDAAAVQVVTIHGSKGLEFPVVYVPYAWDRFVPRDPDPLRLHDDQGQRLVDVGGKQAAGYDERKERHNAEEAGEDLRLLYVAMTRAHCQVVSWWVPSTTTASASLHRFLFGEFASGEQPPERLPLGRDRDVRARLDALATESAGTIGIELVAYERQATRQPVESADEQLSAAIFDRRLDVGWRRTSYTGLTRAVHDPGVVEAGVSSEPEIEERQDEPEATRIVDSPADLDEALLQAVPSPLAGLPSGPAFGTLVHSVLEEVDTTAGDLAAELLLRCATAMGARLGAMVDPAALAAGLLPVLDTPLGALAGDARLRDIAAGDRLAELAFELPLAGGDSADRTSATVARLAALMREHLPKDDRLVTYPDSLDVPALRSQQLRGYLTGSIDAVLRVGASAGEPRYLIVDYKTNWLGGFGPDGAEPLTAWHYRPASMTAEMVHAHYPLQALLYAVALHRFLRWRQPAYDPSVHLGGVLYLFVRGMCGPDTPVVGGTPCGVFEWTPPPDLVVAASALLAGGAR